MLENCRLLLYASRFSGCHPHTIDERSRVPVNFRLLCIYSLIMCGVYFAVGYQGNSLKNDCGTNIWMGCLLHHLDQYVQYAYMVLTTLLSCLRHAEFERAIVAARKFDDLMRLYNNSWCADNKRANYCKQWLGILAILVTSLFVGILQGLTGLVVPKMNLFIYMCLITMRTIFSIEIAKFCFLHDELYRGFCHINRLSGKLTGMGLDTGVSVKNVNRLTISNIQQLHSYLTDATNHFNSYYSLQLFCWIACLLLDTITYIFILLYQVHSVYLISAQSMAIVCFLLQLIAISRICNLTCNQANALGQIIFLAKTSSFKHTEFSIEEIELGIRVRMYPLRIRVCGLFNLDNRLAFTAFGIILMYVILASSGH
ncbi:uncharacterized protein [Anoplolepis gracilipes]|uniref:uncharacterized protein n=1 Tax=Anoplolepis gracilipes TaxID=354296 RepID=UPI003BA3D894